jgi:hypothetical protein
MTKKQLDARDKKVLKILKRISAREAKEKKKLPKEIIYPDRLLDGPKKKGDMWFNFHVLRGEPYVEFHLNEQLAHWFGPGFVFDAIQEHMNRVLLLGMRGLEKKLDAKREQSGAV